MKLVLIGIHSYKKFRSDLYITIVMIEMSFNRHSNKILITDMEKLFIWTYLDVVCGKVIK